MRDDDFFWAGIAAGRLLVQCCDGCGRLRHPPVPMCGDCHALAWTAQAASGRARLHTFIVSRPPGDPMAEPRVVALVELAEGLRLVSNLVDCEADAVTIDMPLELCFREHDGRLLPQFRPAGVV